MNGYSFLSSDNKGVYNTSSFKIAYEDGRL